MTEVNVFVAGGVPLVRLSGTVTERNGAELAAAVMSAIHYMTEDTTEYQHPLSLPAPCTSQ